MKRFELLFIRILDILFSLTGIVFLSPLYCFIFIFCWLDTGRPIFSQKRLGKNKVVFSLYKFRTMNIGTESRPTHETPQSAITRLGFVLRKTKLDELPQLFNVILGQMSLVGPRPGLVDHVDLIKERTMQGVFQVRPGVTGLSQISGIDMSDAIKLAKTDKEMIDSFGLFQYFKIIWQTFLSIKSE